MKITWSEPALQDIADIFSYYWEQANESIANKQVLKIAKSAQLIAEFSYIGHVSDLGISYEILEWVVPCTPYTLPYQIQNSEIQILRVFDTRQQRPKSWNG
jgi:plasmid stabilization system protein ParE